jgi:hypothetical protein
VDAEQLRRVGPSIDRAKSGARRELTKFSDRIFVGISGMGQFAGSEIEAAPGDRRLLVGKAADTDFDPSLGFGVRRYRARKVACGY